MCKCGNDFVLAGDGGGAHVALGTDLEASVQANFTPFPLQPPSPHMQPILMNIAVTVC